MPVAGPSKPRSSPPSAVKDAPSKQLDPPPSGSSIPEPQMQLSSEQRHVLEMVKRGKNVFFTGSAGTGKSVLLREIIKFCRHAEGHQNWGRLGITASTGIASVNIGGCTLHSWAGVGLAKEPKEKLVNMLIGYDHKERQRQEEENEDPEAPRRTDDSTKQGRAADRWRTTRTLIIDESECWDKDGLWYLSDGGPCSIDDRWSFLRQACRFQQLICRLDGLYLILAFF